MTKLCFTNVMQRLTIFVDILSTMSWSKLFSDLVCSSIWNEDDHTRLVWITILAIKGPNQIVRATVGGLAHQARVPLEACRNAVEKLSSPDPDGLEQPYEGRRIQPVEHGWLVLNGEAYKNRKDETYRKEYQAEWVAAKRLKEKLSTRTVDTVDASTPIDKHLHQSTGNNGAPEESHRLSKTNCDGHGQSVTEEEKKSFPVSSLSPLSDSPLLLPISPSEKEKKIGSNGSVEPKIVRSPLMNRKTLQELKEVPAYEGIDLDKEAWKYKTWCDTNNKPPTKRRFVNWLNRIS